MSTNDRKIIRTQHVPTGQMVDFYLSQDVSPSVVNKIITFEKLEKQMEQLEGKDDKKGEMSRTYAKVNRLGLEIFSSILEPKGGIPGNLQQQFGYQNKFDFISDCAQSDFVIAQTINFFYDFLPSSTASRGDKASLEQIKKQVQVISPEDSGPSR
jgi:hypothetical protein